MRIPSAPAMLRNALILTEETFVELFGFNITSIVEDAYMKLSTRVAGTSKPIATTKEAIFDATISTARHD